MKMAKKSSRSDQKYPPPFSMRFTEDERKSLEMAAAGRPLGAYIRWLIFKEDMPEMPQKRTRGETASPDHKELARLLGALGKSRIANNINQLAKAANSGSLPVNKEIIESLNEAVDAVRWMRNTLIKAMGLKPQGGQSGEDSHDP
ncbi:MAG: MobC family plasmid mobilization relaxosome protein [Candidatus Thiodiazotropha sp. (ex Lucina aurantia)]|nr:MobC family plasmid mobilization relaxosome protein [Candidatus Thiodiazotropha taylori]MBV2097812.1 MobC family plasmid mobilization relaxosome protein [Candidatus Thiodiazotropha sp. (ex Codakia orbicularis)]MBV2103315.1 MobC family plasmid mobilization relaxosome protein [Candidatus Thiodiazotropha sp. (ex Lucina aurantia)]MBV2116322.1 MobC family plasmid mobilization relaxosome protein [Candidatus Thiodiazotropha sp. (ex Lucina aurantia)]